MPHILAGLDTVIDYYQHLVINICLLYPQTLTGSEQQGPDQQSPWQDP